MASFFSKLCTNHVYYIIIPLIAVVKFKGHIKYAVVMRKF